MPPPMMATSTSSWVSRVGKERVSPLHHSDGGTACDGVIGPSWRGRGGAATAPLDGSAKARPESLRPGPCGVACSEDQWPPHITSRPTWKKFTSEPTSLLACTMWYGASTPQRMLLCVTKFTPPPTLKPNSEFESLTLPPGVS